MDFFFQYCCSKACPFCYLCVFVKNQQTIFPQIYFQPHIIYISIFPPVLCLLDYCSFMLSLEMKIGESSIFIFPFSNYLAFLAHLFFHTNFKIQLSISTKSMMEFSFGLHRILMKLESIINKGQPLKTIFHDFFPFSMTSNFLCLQSNHKCPICILGLCGKARRKMTMVMELLIINRKCYYTKIASFHE